jgi:hypothetical protein
MLNLFGRITIIVLLLLFISKSPPLSSHTLLLCFSNHTHSLFSALEDNCMMGNCQQSSTSSCVASVEGLCASNDDAASCMDCVLANWDEISNSLNCTIADAGYHCTGY